MYKTRLLFKSILLLIVLFGVCIGLIRAQPYDDSHVRAFFTPPDGCPMPCFMGINPGATTMQVALAILERHEWVGTLRDNTVVNDRSVPANVSGVILWDWSGLQPPMIDETVTGRLWINQGEITGMYIGTRIRLGDMWQALGQPDEGLIVRSDIDLTLRALQATYASVPFGIEAVWYCPVNAMTFWQASLRIIAVSHYGPDEEFKLAYPRC